jgi:hypothetical protein
MYVDGLSTRQTHDVSGLMNAIRQRPIQRSAGIVERVQFDLGAETPLDV